jgi:hypothetical protein
MKNPFVAVSLVLLLCFTFSCHKGEETDDVRIETENGIQVVHNPKNPSPLPGTPKQIIVTEELCIGDEEGAENFVFSQIRSVQIDEAENIYVADSKEACVKVFDKSGNYIRRFGHKGQGPGEIQFPLRMHLFAGKKILIYDNRNRRLSFFSLDGELLKEIPIGKYDFERTIPDSKGNIITHLIYRGDKWVNEIKKFDPNLNPILTIKTIEEEITPYVIAMVSPNFNVRVMANDNIVWGYPLDFKYEIVVVSPEGKTIRKIVKDYDPVTITEEEKQELIKAQFGDRELPPEYKLEFPESYFPYYYFVCGDEGRIYVRTYERDKEGNIRYDVFSPEGRYIAKFYFPELDLIYLVRKNKIYSIIWEDDRGIPVVKRYSRIWK